MADANDPFGTAHPGALVVLGLSTLSTFGAMWWLHQQNEKDHERLQEQLNTLNRRLTAHENDNTRHIRLAPLAGTKRPGFILPSDEAPTLRSPPPVFS